MIPKEPGQADPGSARRFASTGAVAAALLCLALTAVVQEQLLFGTHWAGGVGSALWHWIIRRPVPIDVWYQLPAPIAKTAAGSLPAGVRQRAEPLIDWLASSDGLQQAETLRILPGQNDLTIDLYGIDESGCRRLLQATQAPSAMIDVIGVTAVDAELMPVPTQVSAEKQCERKTGFLRMIRRNDKH